MLISYQPTKNTQNELPYDYCHHSRPPWSCSSYFSNHLPKSVQSILTSNLFLLLLHISFSCFSAHVLSSCFVSFLTFHAPCTYDDRPRRRSNVNKNLHNSFIGLWLSSICIKTGQIKLIAIIWNNYRRMSTTTTTISSFQYVAKIMWGKHFGHFWCTSSFPCSPKPFIDCCNLVRGDWFQV